MKYDKEKIGKIIEKKRKDKRLSQNALGEKINVVGKQISNYENGKMFPPMEALTKLCDVFDCELGFLLGEETYSAGTQLDTAIENKTGLKKETIDNIVKITGTERTCLNRGHESEKYRKILNNFLTSQNFLDIIKVILELDDIYNQEAPQKKLLKEWGEDRCNRAIINRDPEYSNPNLTEEECKDIAKFDKAREEGIKRDYNIAICRFKLKESFTLLLNELYPKEPSEKINFFEL